MRNTMLLLFCLLSTIMVAQAQPPKVDKAYKYLEKKTYEKAFPVFQQGLAYPEVQTESAFGLSTCYFSTSFANNNLDSAYYYINKSADWYKKLDAMRQKELKDEYRISGAAYRSKMLQIEKRAYREAIKESSPEALKHFVDNYPEAEGVDDVKQKLERFSFLEEDTEGKDLLFYMQYVKKYRDLMQPYANHPKVQQVWRDFYTLYTNDGELISLMEFEKFFPEFPFQDTLYYDKQVAAEGAMAFARGDTEMAKQFIAKSAPKELAFVAVQKFLTYYIQVEDYNKALEVLNKLAVHFPEDDKRIVNLRKLLTEPVDSAVIRPVDGGINTMGNEYVPVPSADGQSFYFCGMDRADNLGSEDIFVSRWNGLTWGNAQLVDKLNTAYGAEAPLSISADGTRLLTFSSSNQGDILSSRKTKDGWSTPQFIREVNSAKWDADAMITSDGNALIFASTRPGCYNTNDSLRYHGNVEYPSDIFICLKTKYGWGKPINLGPVINTRYCERSPFLHADMKTLYFSSDGHGGLGGLDVYKTTRLNDTSWTEWSEPVNLGRAINTPGKDWGYRFSTDGKYAYFSRVQNKNFDLYRAELPKKLRPNFVGTISGRLLSSKGEALDGVIRWEDLSTGQPIGEAQSNPQDGSYFVVMPMGKNYGYYVEKKGYYPASGNVDMRVAEQMLNVKKDIILYSVEELKQGQKISLNNVFFDTNKFDLKPESFPELKRLAGFINSDATFVVEVSGHTDNVGSAAQNKTLSENRAMAVRDYLVSLGCAKERLQAKGYGAEKPVATNNTDEGKAQNRRVEFRLVK